MKINKIRLLDKNRILIANISDFKTNEDFLDEIAFQLENGIKIVLLVTSNNSAKDLLIVGKVIRELCSIYNSLFIVESRVDIAMLVHADGIHLTKNDIPTENAKEMLGENVIIGYSIEEKEENLDENIDYFISKKEIKNLEKPCYIEKKEKNKIICEKI